MEIGKFVEYRGFIGSIEFSPEDGCYHGKVLHIKDVIGYEGQDVVELYEQYKLAVNDYIEFKSQMVSEVLGGTVSPRLYALAVEKEWI